MNIFQVISNISHNGNRLNVGDIFEAELAEFEHLVKSGALKIINGVESVEEAKAQVEPEKSETSEKSEAPEDQQNTWGPKKDEAKAPETAPENASDAKTDETADTEAKPQAGEDGATKDPSETADKPADGATDTGDDL